jgi:O-antigen chain-terminating methyltransferase
MTEGTNSNVDGETVRRGIRDAVARRKQLLDARDRANRTDPVAVAHDEESGRPRQSSLLRAPDPGPTIERRESYADADFLEYQDEDFVRNAYRAILKRDPDPEGRRHYLSLLRSGALSKRGILSRLRYSPEGRTANVEVTGLRSTYVLDTARRLPIVGYLVSMIWAALRLPRMAQDIRHTQAMSNKTHAELARRVDALAAETECESRELLGKADALALASLVKVVADLDGRKAETRTVAALANELARLRKSKVETAALALVASEIAAIRERKADASQVSELRSELSGAWRDVEKTKGQLIDHARSVVDQERRLGILLEQVHRARTDGDGLSSNESVRAEEDHLLDAFYATFEDRFRGPREEIKDRVRVYLPVVQAAGAGTPDAPILDVGCGRGEWLEVLKECGLIARGVDMNRIMTMRCRELGLDVIEGDVLACLRGCDADSVGAVTGFHIIEHLEYRTLIALLDETLRVLKPGGVAIFETPNPENLIVAACNFYYDPTHRRPLPPEPMRYIVEARGFERVTIERLHPLPLSDSVAAELAKTSFAQWFASAQDYGVIGHKGVAPNSSTASGVR